MARVTSDLQSETAAETPTWPGPGAGGLDAASPQNGNHAATVETEAESEAAAQDGVDAEAAPYDAPMRRRARGIVERGRVWYRPNGAPRPEPRPPLRERLV